MNADLVHELEKELFSIMHYWTSHTVDAENGGFYGQLANDNTVASMADKGAVLNGRILWFLSALYNYNPLPGSLELAERSYTYIKNHFIDKQFGGVYWSVDFAGNALNTKKQIYAIAFIIYGLAEFYKARKNEEVLALAIELYADIEKYSFDSTNGGYIEAFSREWATLADLRLSAKDDNEKKTMNTHLHILEAYSKLYSIWPDERLGQQIRNLLNVFSNKIIDKRTHHLHLFFDDNWISKSNVVSFGHDIEASWLLLEAAEALNDTQLILQFKSVALLMADSSLRGMDQNGGLNYELEDNHWNTEKHWWVQAEAMVGYFNAFQITNKRSYFDHFYNCWQFIKTHIVDHEAGEWFWATNGDGSLMSHQYKVGLWKCPYHNGRACLELIRRLNSDSVHKNGYPA